MKKRPNIFLLNTSTVLVVVLSTVLIPDKKSLMCADFQNCFKSLFVTYDNYVIVIVGLQTFI